MIKQKYVCPSEATVGDIVTFTYNKDGTLSHRAGVVAQSNQDRFLIEDFTEQGSPRMFLFPRIVECSVVSFEEKTPEKRNLGYWLKKCLGFD